MPPVPPSPGALPHVQPDGQAVVIAGPKEFKPNSAVTPSTVNGVGLVDTAGTGLLSFTLLDEPIEFIDAMSVFMIGYTFTLTQPGTPTANIVP